MGSPYLLLPAVETPQMTYKGPLLLFPSPFLHSTSCDHLPKCLHQNPCFGIYFSGDKKEGLNEDHCLMEKRERGQS